MTAALHHLPPPPSERPLRQLGGLHQSEDGLAAELTARVQLGAGGQVALGAHVRRVAVPTVGRVQSRGGYWSRRVAGGGEGRLEGHGHRSRGAWVTAQELKIASYSNRIALHYCIYWLTDCGFGT